jgi:hypothetical protein
MEAYMREQPPRPRRVGAFWWCLVPFFTFGLFTFVMILIAGTRLRHRPTKIMSIVYLAAFALFFVGAQFSDPGRSGWIDIVIFPLLLLSWLGGTIHVLLLQIRPMPIELSTLPSRPEGGAAAADVVSVPPPAAGLSLPGSDQPLLPKAPPVQPDQPFLPGVPPVQPEQARYLQDDPATGQPDGGEGAERTPQPQGPTPPAPRQSQTGNNVAIAGAVVLIAGCAGLVMLVNYVNGLNAKGEDTEVYGWLTFILLPVVCLGIVLMIIGFMVQTGARRRASARTAANPDMGPAPEGPRPEQR